MGDFPRPAVTANFEDLTEYLDRQTKIADSRFGRLFRDSNRANKPSKAKLKSLHGNIQNTNLGPTPMPFHVMPRRNQTADPVVLAMNHQNAPSSATPQKTNGGEWRGWLEHVLFVSTPRTGRQPVGRETDVVIRAARADTIGCCIRPE